MVSFLKICDGGKQERKHQTHQQQRQQTQHRQTMATKTLHSRTNTQNNKNFTPVHEYQDINYLKWYKQPQNASQVDYWLTTK